MENNLEQVVRTCARVSRYMGEVESAPLTVNGFHWVILIKPHLKPLKLDPNTEQITALGIFIKCSSTENCDRWECDASCSFRLISFDPERESLIKVIPKHTFTDEKPSFGYSNFVEWTHLMNPSNGFIFNDAIIVEAKVKMHDRLLDSNSVGLNTLRPGPTQYIGLKNQGATCYMNSLLQTLYFTNQFRQAVYEVLPMDREGSDIVIALQKLFYQLQTSTSPVGTEELTKSFGWDAQDSIRQHDAHEFLRMFMARLDSIMKGTSVEGTIQDLFQGQQTTFFRCKNVEYSNCRLESFLDIQLNVENSENIYTALREYVCPNTLEGENKYDAGHYGLQDAETEVVFDSFPSVLHFQLRRFSYNFETKVTVKYNGRFEFYEKIDLTDFISDHHCSAERQAFTLHAVLVHSGSVNGGHYVVFLNPNGDGNWFKFNDAVVHQCTKTEAIERNFGGDWDVTHPLSANSTNAYMLVYIKDSALNTVLKEVSSDVIPPGVLGWENVDTKAQNEHSLSLCLDDSYQNAWTRALMQIFPYNSMLQEALVSYNGLTGMVRREVKRSIISTLEATRKLNLDCDTFLLQTQLTIEAIEWWSYKQIRGGGAWKTPATLEVSFTELHQYVVKPIKLMFDMMEDVNNRILEGTFPMNAFIFNQGKYAMLDFDVNTIIEDIELIKALNFRESIEPDRESSIM